MSASGAILFIATIRTLSGLYMNEYCLVQVDLIRERRGCRQRAAMQEKPRLECNRSLTREIALPN